jgi:hypothetical protein
VGLRMSRGGQNDFRSEPIRTREQG